VANQGGVVAIYHLAAKIISRATGRSAVAAAAYRSASRLHDERLGHDQSFLSKSGVIHSAILLPAGAPDRLADRATLWNEVEAFEKRKDAQLAREVELALPRELSDADTIELARAFVQEAFVTRGMIADLNVHKPVDAPGLAKPLAHVMLTLREVGEGGFGRKVRAWNGTDLLRAWRELLAVRINEKLAERGHDARVDHRSFKAREIALEPQNKIGSAGARRNMRGQASERALEHRRIAERNGERLLADPAMALDMLTEQQSTFTRADLARLVARHTDGAEQFRAVLAKVEAHPDLVRVGKDGWGRERLSTRRMIKIEERLEAQAAALAERQRHGLDRRRLERLAADRGLGPEQRTALLHVTRAGGMALVTGFAGTGKSHMLGAARQAWEEAGYRVRGAALSGIAAEGLANGSGIESRTLASWAWAWARDRERLGAHDVLVVDEAGMVGSRQMERVVAAVWEAGAKLVLVGDPEQLQAIEAGAAFRALAERHGVASLTAVRRQQEDWQREATKELATARTGAALARYDAAGMVHEALTREDARAALIEQWDERRRARSEDSRMILAATRAEVQALNMMARERLRASGDLGEDHMVRTERGSRRMAVGERVMFLRNERSLGVRNGTLGTIASITGARLGIRLDDGGGHGREVVVELKDYAHLEHGYASTIHKAQGITVNEAHVLATPHMDRHGSYVALTRHRERVSLHHAREDFADRAALADRLGRERAKDTTLDYGHEQSPSAERTAAAIDRVARALREARERSVRVTAAISTTVRTLKERSRARDGGRGR
jgi:Ti-type conjugative transfer relaxase TraA